MNVGGNEPSVTLPDMKSREASDNDVFSKSGDLGSNLILEKDAGGVRGLKKSFNSISFRGTDLFRDLLDEFRENIVFCNKISLAVNLNQNTRLP